MKRLILLLVIAAFFVGCGPAGPGPGDIRLKRPVTAQQAVGVWTLRNDCLSRLIETKGYQAPAGATHEIELRPDGSCRFRSVLQFPARYVDWEGSWDLVSEDAKTTALHLSLKGNGGHACRLGFTELFGVVELFEYGGDPDACEIFRFEKTSQVRSRNL